MWNDLCVIDYLTNFDFIMIQETWCESEYDIGELQSKLQGYKCFSECATRVSKYGRPSGGTAVFCKEKYSKCVQKLILQKVC